PGIIASSFEKVHENRKPEGPGSRVSGQLDGAVSVHDAGTAQLFTRYPRSEHGRAAGCHFRGVCRSYVAQRSSPATGKKIADEVLVSGNHLALMLKDRKPR